MLNRKNLMILAVVLVVLVAVSLLQRSQHEAATSRSSSDELVSGEYARADLARIVIGYGDRDELIVMRSDPDQWRLPTAFDARADEKKIDTLLRSISGLRGEFRSDSEAVLADYGFTDSTTVRIRGEAVGGGEAFALEIGAKPQGSQGNFVRRPGETAVYLSTANLLGDLGLWSGSGEPENRHFVQLLAYKSDRLEVDSVALWTEDWSYEIVKEYQMTEPAPGDTTGAEPTVDHKRWDWKFGDGAPAKKTTSDGVLNASVSIRAQDIVDPDVDLASYGLDEPTRRLTVRHRDGTVDEIVFGSFREAEGDAPAGHYAMVTGEKTVWVIGDFTVNNIFKTQDVLQP